jgi:hypothetical protein
MVGGQSEQIVLETPISKITRAKWTRGVAQVVHGLLCKCKALSSNPSPIKKRVKYFLLLLVLGFELRASCLQDRCCTM